MATVTVDPGSLQRALDVAVAGTTLALAPGRYSAHYELRGRQGAEDAPIVIRGDPDAVFDGGQTVDDFTPRAEQVAREAQKLGLYPGVYPIAAEAQLRIVGCAWVALEGLRFRQCWPTAIYLQDSTRIAIRDTAVTGSTYAIYAEGAATRHLLVERCRWVQDATRRRLWRDTHWASVHGVDEAHSGGSRAYDGTFFNGFGIAGDVEVRHCVIEHAFNGVHGFSGKGPPFDSSLNRNVHVHHNVFRFIKDNPIEPEDIAQNWWIHDNVIFNAHKWFSFDFHQGAFIYVFRNRGYFSERPGPPDEEFAGGAVFKVEQLPKIGPPLGDTNVFNNSWYLRSAYIKDGAIHRFRHSNNAIQYCAPSRHGEAGLCEPDRSFFKTFATNWAELGIAFVGDCVAHRDFPAGLQAKGYPIKDGRGAAPGFRAPHEGDFVLLPGSPCLGAGVKLDLAMPDGSYWRSTRALDIGAEQTDAASFDGLTYRPLP